MPRLPAGWFAARLLRRPLGQRGLRTRGRGRLGQVAEASFHLRETCFQSGDAFVPLATSWTLRLLHPFTLAAGKTFSCASFVAGG
jgi:hypothetical protein